MSSAKSVSRESSRDRRRDSSSSRHPADSAGRAGSSSNRRASKDDFLKVNDPFKAPRDPRSRDPKSSKSSTSKSGDRDKPKTGGVKRTNSIEASAAAAANANASKKSDSRSTKDNGNGNVTKASVKELSGSNFQPQVLLNKVDPAPEVQEPVKEPEANGKPDKPSENDESMSEPPKGEESVDAISEALRKMRNFPENLQNHQPATPNDDRVEQVDGNNDMESDDFPESNGKSNASGNGDDGNANANTNTKGDTDRRGGPNNRSNETEGDKEEGEHSGSDSEDEKAAPEYLLVDAAGRPLTGKARRQKKQALKRDFRRAAVTRHKHFAQRGAQFLALLDECDLPRTTTRAKFVNIAKGRDYNGVLKHYMDNTWASLSEPEKDGKEGKILRDLMVSSVLYKHQTLAQKCKAKFAAQQLKKANKQLQQQQKDQAPVAGPSGAPARQKAIANQSGLAPEVVVLDNNMEDDNAGTEGDWQKVGPTKRKAKGAASLEPVSKRANGNAGGNVGNVGNAGGNAGNADAVAKSRQQEEIRAHHKRSYIEAVTAIETNPLTLQVQGVQKVKVTNKVTGAVEEEELLVGINGTQWRDSLAPQWLKAVGEEITKARHSAKVAREAGQPVPDMQFPRFTDTRFEDSKVYLVPLDSYSHTWAIGTIEEIVAGTKRFRAVPLQELEPSCLVSFKAPAELLPINLTAVWGDIQFASGIPEDATSKFISADVTGVNTLKKVLVRVTKGVWRLLKGGHDTMGRRPGCIKLGAGNFELWCQSKPLTLKPEEDVNWAKVPL